MEEKGSQYSSAVAPGAAGATTDIRPSEDTFLADEDALAQLGYKSELLREFGNLETFSFAMSIMGMTASIATTFTTPLRLAGFASVVWCWIAGSLLNISFGASIAEIVSAYPTAGGLYTATAYLVPKRWRAITGWVTGYLNILGQTAGIASTEWGLAGMILAAVVICRPGYEIQNWHQFLLYAGLLTMHGITNSLPTKYLARLTRYFVFINIGTAFLIIIVLLAMTPRAEMHSGHYIFTTIDNQSGWANNGLAMSLGLLSVQWTMTDYDAAAHISEEVKRAAIAAPVAIFTAVINTGLIGWVLNIVLCICAGDIQAAGNDGLRLGEKTGNAVLEIMYLRIGKAGSMVLWSLVCLISVFTVQAGLHANARTVFAFSRDGGFPDRGWFGKISKVTQTPVVSVWVVIVLSLLLGVLSFASLIAVGAIFSMCAVALDLSYIIPVICRRVFANHPEVVFHQGPFYMGSWGLYVNLLMIVWGFYEVTILTFPQNYPFDEKTFNYSWVITLGVMFVSLIWYAVGGRKYYDGPRANLDSLPQVEDKAFSDTKE